MPAIDLLLTGTQPEGNLNELIKGEALMIQFDKWFQNNIEEIFQRLEKYGFKVRK